ncbi:MAG: hypothetical protein IKZ54_08195 [Bacteroidales bacterium]|nr:hypothetical protein [Bacteroidales bacterium]
MNKKSTFILIVVCVFGLFNLSAQKGTTRFFFALNRSLAYTNQERFPSNPDIGAFVGGGENVGIGYQLYANHFIFSVGLEAGVTIMSNSSKSDILYPPHNDFIPQGTLEAVANLHFNIPMMIGGEFGKFYFKAGIVPSFNLINGGVVFGPVLSPHNSTMFGTLDGIRYKNPFQLFGRFEIGGSIGKFTPFDANEQPTARFYLGGYVDFGITKDIPSKSCGHHYSHTIPYAISSEGIMDNVHQMSVGLRFTCLFNLAK